MITRRHLMMYGLGAGIGAAALAHGHGAQAGTFPLTLTDVQWRSRLKPDQYAVLRQAATEIPFSSPLLNEHRLGVFYCAGCQQDLFSSRTKFDSRTGWPSFWAPISKTAVATTTDTSLGMVRQEVHCTRCGGHQGHLFDDGPRPTGLRYCMNGVSMGFRPTAA